MNYLSIDRIENGIAVCEDNKRKRVEIPLSQIDGSPKEGDVIDEVNGRYVIDQKETTKRRAAVFRLQQKLFGNGK